MYTIGLLLTLMTKRDAYSIPDCQYE